VLLRYRALGTLLPDAEATVTMDYTPLVWLKLVVVSAGEALRLCLLPWGQTLYYGRILFSEIPTRLMLIPVVRARQHCPPLDRFYIRRL
jgi:hypothetical protein